MTSSEHRCLAPLRPFPFPVVPGPSAQGRDVDGINTSDPRSVLFHAHRTSGSAALLLVDEDVRGDTTAAGEAPRKALSHALNHWGGKALFNSVLAADPCEWYGSQFLPHVMGTRCQQRQEELSATEECAGADISSLSAPACMQWWSLYVLPSDSNPGCADYRLMDWVEPFTTDATSQQVLKGMKSALERRNAGSFFSKAFDVAPLWMPIDAESTITQHVHRTMAAPTYQSLFAAARSVTHVFALWDPHTCLFDVSCVFRAACEEGARDHVVRGWCKEALFSTGKTGCVYPSGVPPTLRAATLQVRECFLMMQRINVAVTPIAKRLRAALPVFRSTRSPPYAFEPLDYLLDTRHSSCVNDNAVHREAEAVDHSRKDGKVIQPITIQNENGMTQADDSAVAVDSFLPNADRSVTNTMVDRSIPTGIKEHESNVFRLYEYYEPHSSPPAPAAAAQIPDVSPSRSEFSMTVVSPLTPAAATTPLTSNQHKPSPRSGGTPAKESTSLIALGDRLRDSIASMRRLQVMEAELDARLITAGKGIDRAPPACPAAHFPVPAARHFRPTRALSSPTFSMPVPRARMGSEDTGMMNARDTTLVVDVSMLVADEEAERAQLEVARTKHFVSLRRDARRAWAAYSSALVEERRRSLCDISQRVALLEQHYLTESGRLQSKIDNAEQDVARFRRDAQLQLQRSAEVGQVAHTALCAMLDAVYAMLDGDHSALCGESGSDRASGSSIPTLSPPSWENCVRGDASQAAVLTTTPTRLTTAEACKSFIEATKAYLHQGVASPTPTGDADPTVSASSNSVVVDMKDIESACGWFMYLHTLQQEVEEAAQATYQCQRELADRQSEQSAVRARIQEVVSEMQTLQRRMWEKLSAQRGDARGTSEGKGNK